MSSIARSILSDFEIDALLLAVGLGRPHMDPDRPDMRAALARATKILAEQKTAVDTSRKAVRSGRVAGRVAAARSRSFTE